MDTTLFWTGPVALVVSVPAHRIIFFGPWRYALCGSRRGERLHWHCLPHPPPRNCHNYKLLRLKYLDTIFVDGKQVYDINSRIALNTTTLRDVGTERYDKEKTERRQQLNAGQNIWQKLSRGGGGECGNNLLQSSSQYQAKTISLARAYVCEKDPTGWSIRRPWNSITPALPEASSWMRSHTSLYTKNQLVTICIPSGISRIHLT